MKKSIIIIGRICSGKSSLARSLSESLNIPKASFGGYLVELAPEFNLKVSRDSLQNLGQSLINSNPEKFLADVIEFSGSSEEMIFEGVRHKIIKEKIEQISRAAISFYIEVPTEVRLQRCVERGDINISKVEFDQWDNHIVEQEIEGLKNKCTHILDGSQSSLDLKKEVIYLLSKED